LTKHSALSGSVMRRQFGVSRSYDLGLFDKDATDVLDIVSSSSPGILKDGILVSIGLYLTEQYGEPNKNAETFSISTRPLRYKRKFGNLNSSTSFPTLNRIHCYGSPASKKHSILIKSTRSFVPLPIGNVIDTITPAPPFFRH
jgi:hypothetical protein